MLSRRALALVFLIVAVTLAGCAASGPERHKVSGSVQFRGRPLEKGLISFVPEDPARGEFATLPINGGKYETPASNGLLAGKYKVLISSPAGEMKPPGPDDPPGISGIQKDLIPARYNEKSDLTREVKAGDPNVFDFELK